MRPAPAFRSLLIASAIGLAGCAHGRSDEAYSASLLGQRPAAELAGCIAAAVRAGVTPGEGGTSVVQAPGSPTRYVVGPTQKDPTYPTQVSVSGEAAPVAEQRQVALCNAGLPVVASGM